MQKRTLSALVLSCCMLLAFSFSAFAEPQRDVAVERDKVTKEATLKVETKGKWTLYAGRSAGGIDYKKPVMSGSGKGAFKVPVDPSVHWFFAVDQGGRKKPFAENLLPMEKGYNYRDLGGFKAAGGKTVKYGLIFRSGDLMRLTEADYNYLASIPITTLVDFRGGPEVKKGPSPAAFMFPKRIWFPVVPGSIETGTKPEDFFAGNIDDKFMEDFYKTYVTSDIIVATWREFYAMVQDEKNLPLMYHCSAGKDRTGFTSAVIMLALGVDKEDIMAEYELTNVYLADKYQPVIKKEPHRAALFYAKRQYLEAAINAMVERSGSVENFLTRDLGIDLQKMRALYLE